jgi:hypothetical protein
VNRRALVCNKRDVASTDGSPGVMVRDISMQIGHQLK